MEDNGLRARMEKVFFAAGDRVEVKHDIENKPMMVVQKIDKITMGGGSALLGVTCFWFSSDMKLQSHRFNTKDLSKL